jgi:hypothetical protein
MVSALGSVRTESGLRKLTVGKPLSNMATRAPKALGALIGTSMPWTAWAASRDAALLTQPVFVNVMAIVLVQVAYTGAVAEFSW